MVSWWVWWQIKWATVRHCLHKDGHSITLLLSFSLIVFSPLLRLSPPPGDHDYIYNLDETEGLCDLFDVPITNLWPPNTPYNESSVLKRTFFFWTLFKGGKKKAWLCVRSICMISWFCVYIKLFLCVYLLQPQSGRLKMNLIQLLRSDEDIRHPRKPFLLIS